MKLFGKGLAFGAVAALALGSAARRAGQSVRRRADHLHHHHRSGRRLRHLRPPRRASTWSGTCRARQVVVQNVPGAGHIVGTNTLYAAAPDGLTIGSFNTGLINSQLLEREGIQFDLSQMSWIGKAATDTRSLVVSKDCPYQSIDDMKAAPEPIKMAAAGVGSAAYIDTILIGEALGLNLEIIPGFEGTEGEMSHDARRGLRPGRHAPLRCSPSSRTATASSSCRSAARRPRAFRRRATSPSATNGQAIIAIIDALSEISRLTAGPPGIPEDRLQILRDAYMAALTDPDLIAEAQQLDIPIEPAAGDVVAERVQAALEPDAGDAGAAPGSDEGRIAAPGTAPLGTADQGHGTQPDVLHARGDADVALSADADGDRGPHRRLLRRPAGPWRQARHRPPDPLRLRHGPDGGRRLPARHAFGRPHRRRHSEHPLRRARRRPDGGHRHRRLRHDQEGPGRPGARREPRRVRHRRRDRRAVPGAAHAGDQADRAVLQPGGILPAGAARHHLHRHALRRQSPEGPDRRLPRPDDLLRRPRPVDRRRPLHLRPALPVGRRRRHHRRDRRLRHPRDDRARRAAHRRSTCPPERPRATRSAKSGTASSTASATGG